MEFCLKFCRSFSKSTETVPKTVSSLDTQLKYMEDFSRRGRFIAREYTDELLQSISRQQATSPQIVRAFQFCGNLTSLRYFIMMLF